MAYSLVRKAPALHGVLFVMLLALAAVYIAGLPGIRGLGISPLIVGILLGMAYANSLRDHFPAAWTPGIAFCQRPLLRLAIIFYGFRLTFQDIAAVGVSGILVGGLVVLSTFLIGYVTGTKLLKLDRETTILTAAGSAICGAAAILATEPVLKSAPHKGAVAVATVVLFGTLAMFLYPALYQAGLIPLGVDGMGLYVGGTLHEVAHVVAAGGEVGGPAADGALIVKMIRVMMLAPFLILLSLWLGRGGRAARRGAEKVPITIPWFAVLFIGMAGVNSLDLIPAAVVSQINNLDGFGFTMAMTAMGMETRFGQLRGIGPKPVFLAALLFGWLIFGGFGIVKLILA